ncbi:MAG: GerAB/ArcD/ProY family transporter [Clostridium sp.]|nr:GerAB/ArcD/ProY family transporter [Clostridium sp.]MCM1547880.1 GerAB/ArcD/ProY family transporter [Ruminococcus sp.]
MSKISNTQLFAILLSIKAFGIISSETAADASHMAGAAISVALWFILAIPMMTLYKQNGFSLKKEMLFGRAGMLVYALFFIAEGALAFRRIWIVSSSVYFPVDSSLVCAVIIAAVCIYCASMKLNALSRASLIIMGILVFSIAVMILGAYPKADLANYIPDASVESAAKSTMKSLCSSGELVMLFLLLEFSSADRKKGVSAFFIGTLILTELIYIIEITVLGKIISMADLPFFTAGAFSQPLSIQRADSIYMITFTLLGVLTITLRLVMTSMLIKNVIPDLKYNTLLSVILMLGLSAVLNMTNVDIAAFMGIMTLILSVIVPIIMLIRRKSNAGKNISNNNNDASDVRMQS